jgi:hypothetical protein
MGKFKEVIEIISKTRASTSMSIEILTNNKSGSDKNEVISIQIFLSPSKKVTHYFASICLLIEVALFEFSKFRENVRNCMILTD